KAEDPEKMLKQVILDMENQMLQVKTQVAIAIADEHLLAKKQKENTAKISEWMRKAEMAVEKDKDDLARAALDRVETLRRMAEALDDRFDALEREDRIEQMLTELKSRRALTS